MSFRRRGAHAARPGPTPPAASNMTGHAPQNGVGACAEDVGPGGANWGTAGAGGSTPGTGAGQGVSGNLSANGAGGSTGGMVSAKDAGEVGAGTAALGQGASNGTVGSKPRTAGGVLRRGSGRGTSGVSFRAGNRGRRVNGLLGRPSLPKVIVAVLAVVFGVVGFAGGLWSTPSAEPTVAAFLLDWQQQQYQAAAGLTTGRPRPVAAALRNAYLQLDAAAFYFTMGRITQHGTTAQASFQASVDLGQDGAPWNYNGSLSLRQTGSTWRIVWSPSVINPGLRPGLRLAVVSVMPPRALLEDRSGVPLQTPSTVVAVGVRPGHLAHPWATASALGRVTKLDSSQLLGWMLAAPRTPFQELVVLRPGQYFHLASQLRRVPGLVIRQERQRLFASIAPGIVGSVGTEVSPTLRNQGIAYRPGTTIGLSGLQRANQRALAGTPTIEVVTETASGRQVSVLARWPGAASVPVRTTLDARTQLAADAAVASQPLSASVVAVQSSSGAILAVASQTAGAMPAIDPLTGRYAPGPAFTIVSTEALLSGGLRVTAPVPCNTLIDIGGHIFRNVPAARGLGAQPLFAADFAHACGTAFSGLSLRLTGSELRTAASGFGLGSSWQLPLAGFSGSLPPPGSVAGLAADTIGAGDVQVSPLAMALIAGQVDSGKRLVPSLIAGSPAAARTAKPTDPPFSSANLTVLRALMRDTVHSGVARQADLVGQAVYGQVGTVQVRAGKHPVWASWFVGYRGDEAFAAVEFGPSPTTSAVPLARRFLTAAPAR